MRNSGLCGGGGLSGAFCVLFKGKCCAFCCSAIFRRLRLRFSKVRPEDVFSDIVGEIFRVRTCTVGAYPVSFVCCLRGNAVWFFAARFSGDLGHVFQKFAPKIFFSDFVGENFRVRTCTGSVSSGVVVDFYMEKSTVLPEKPRGKKFSFC